uniref:Uncharacterized protein n=1 Tax=Mesocestoides corti TaxID=53468 RepID=A0A5K3G059_MESCO
MHTLNQLRALSRRRRRRPLHVDLTCLAGRQCVHILPRQSTLLRSLLLSLSLSLSDCNCPRLSPTLAATLTQ